MEMYEKDNLVLSMFNDEITELTYKEIKDYVMANGCDKFGPATLTSMVSRGLLNKRKSYYSLAAGPVDKEYAELESEVRKVEGLLNHLISSYCYWTQVMGERNIENNSYELWYQKMTDVLHTELDVAKSKRAEYENKHSAF